MAARFNLADFRYAHRGLWQPEGPVENTLAAYQAAAAAGCGIEMDVRLTADEQLVCFHDATLDRLTEARGSLAQHAADTLSRLTLGGTEETIPPFETLLAEWPQKLPLLVEMKCEAEDCETIARQVGAALADYAGYAAAMSFSQVAVAALPQDIQRGLLIKPVKDIGEEAFRAAIKAAIDDLRVDYLGVRHEDAPLACTEARSQGLGVVVWTVNTPAQSLSVAPYCDAQIFEAFSPDLVARA